MEKEGETALFKKVIVFYYRAKAAAVASVL